ncbi:MAG: methylglyoxal synthase [Yoonia sp.]
MCAANRWTYQFNPTQQPTKGTRLLEVMLDLRIVALKGGPLGGDQQICAMIFFANPLSPVPHDVYVKALIRLVTDYDLPMTCIFAIANLISDGIRDQRI